VPTGVVVYENQTFAKNVLYTLPLSTTLHEEISLGFVGRVGVPFAAARCVERVKCLKNIKKSVSQFTRRRKVW
jgi:hypothetical protein